MKKRSKSFPLSPCRRKSLDPYQSPNPIENFEGRRNSEACVVSCCSGIDCFLYFHGECLDAELGCSNSEEEEESLVLNPYCCFNNLALREYASLSADGYNGYSSDSDTEDDETRVNTSLSGLDDDDNGYSVDTTTEIISDQEVLQGEEDDACSSNVLLDKDSDQSNITLVEETDTEEELVIDEAQASEDETSFSGDVDNGYSVDTTTDIISDQDELQGDEDSDKSNMLLVEGIDPEEYNTGNRRRITLKAIDSGISSNESTNKQAGEDVTEQITKVAKSKTVRDILFSDKEQRSRILWTFEEEEMLKDDTFGSGSSTADCDSDAESVVVPVTNFDERNVPHKKRHYPVTGRSGGSENLLHNSVSDDCVVCEVSDKCVTGLFGLGCLVSFHEECLNAELGSSEEEDLADSYCPYCWFHILAVRDKAVVGLEIADFEYTNLSCDDDNEYSLDTTEITSDQEDLQGDKDDACSSKEEEYEVEAFDDGTAQDKASVNATLYGDENGYSSDTTEIISDQELQGDKDDACSSKGEQVHVNNDSDKSNMPLVEETDSEDEYYTETLQVIDEVQVFNDETSQDQTRVGRCAAGEKGDGSGKENDQVQPNENRRRIALEAIDSEVSSNESTNEPTGEDVAQVAKSKTVRNISVFFNKDQRRRILWTSEEVEMLKVGVEKFAAEVKLNIPWRKILEMGKNVFHETRNPASLKDKWKNMIRAI